MSENLKGKIGVFDSGFGGLNILKSIVKELPQYDFIYLGDSARAPYGSRTKEVIYEFTKEAVDFLFNNGAKLIIIACNSASADALRKIQQEYLPEFYPGNKVLGVLIPAVEECTKNSKTKKVGVMATEATVSSGAFERELHKIDPKIEIFQKACPLLVEIVEEGKEDGLETDIILKNYLEPLLREDIDTLILGCTHFGILEDKIKDIIPKNIQIISEAGIVAKKLNEYLSRHPEIENVLSKNSERVFYTTDTTSKFEALGSKFYGEQIVAKTTKLKG